MTLKINCSADKEDFIEVEKVGEDVLFEIVNYYNLQDSDERNVDFAIVSLKLNQVEELYKELGKYLGIIQYKPI